MQGEGAAGCAVVAVRAGAGGVAARAASVPLLVVVVRCPVILLYYTLLYLPITHEELLNVYLT